MSMKNKMISITNRLEEVTNVLTQFRSLIDSHMVNFFTHKLWEKNVPVGLKKEVKSVPLDVALQTFWNFKSTNKEPMQCAEINKFLSRIEPLYLGSFENLLDLNQLKALMRDWGCSDYSIKLDQSFMSMKKSHEVEVMSSVTASLSKALNCSHIVDVGGGKGYLSAVLCLEHKFKILGLDSSSTNTHTATKRTQRMQRAWDSVRRRIEEGDAYQKKGKNWKSKTNINCLFENVCSDDNQISTDNQQNDCLNSEVNQNNSGGAPSCSTNNARNLLLNNNFKQATHYVSRNTQLLDVVDNCFPDDENINLALIGLHTCGDLGASCLRLFIDNTPTGLVHLLVNVGCCYHLMTEKYPGTPSLKQSSLLLRADDCIGSDADFGFPMSKFLCSKKFGLSYNSRVLSSQSVERISEQNKMPSELLFYRAVLEVILRSDNYVDRNEPIADKDLYCVGHVKCNSFPEYVVKAFKKLGLQLQLSETELVQLYEDYEKYKNELYIYFMMRVALAPLVEAVILLDRLLYLYENGINEAHLVRMFDPLLSPRCYGILAFRKVHPSSGSSLS